MKRSRFATPRPAPSASASFTSSPASAASASASASAAAAAQRRAASRESSALLERELPGALRYIDTDPLFDAAEAEAAPPSVAERVTAAGSEGTSQPLLSAAAQEDSSDSESEGSAVGVRVSSKPGAGVLDTGRSSGWRQRHSALKQRMRRARLERAQLQLTHIQALVCCAAADLHFEV
jgi:hypothetical protein